MLGLGGCMTTLIPATSSIQFDPKTMEYAGPVSIELSSFYLLGILPVTGQDSTAQGALEAARAQLNCDTIINTIVEVEESRLAYVVFLSRKVRVTGIGIRFKGHHSKTQIKNDQDTDPDDQFEK